MNTFIQHLSSCVMWRTAAFSHSLLSCEKKITVKLSTVLEKTNGKSNYVEANVFQ